MGGKTSQKPPGHVQNKDEQSDSSGITYHLWPLINYLLKLSMNPLFPYCSLVAGVLSIAFGPALSAVINEWFVNMNVQQNHPEDLLKQTGKNK